jgi:hypothetical protein
MRGACDIFSKSAEELVKIDHNAYKSLIVFIKIAVVYMISICFFPRMAIVLMVWTTIISAMFTKTMSCSCHVHENHPNQRREHCTTRHAGKIVKAIAMRGKHIQNTAFFKVLPSAFKNFVNLSVSVTRRASDC